MLRGVGRGTPEEVDAVLLNIESFVRLYACRRNPRVRGERRSLLGAAAGEQFRFLGISGILAPASDMSPRGRDTGFERFSFFAEPTRGYCMYAQARASGWAPAELQPYGVIQRTRCKSWGRWGRSYVHARLRGWWQRFFWGAMGRRYSVQAGQADRIASFYGVELAVEVAWILGGGPAVAKFSQEPSSRPTGAEAQTPSQR